MVDDKIKVTHDNNGRFYRIKMDLAKEGSEVWDLTPYFKGRVGDNRFGLQVVWTCQGRLLDTTGMKPYIEGNVGNYSFDDKKDLQLAPDAATVRYTGSPSDCQSGGRVTYYFPEQMFPRDGIFKGSIGLLDDRDDSSQPHISGVTVWFRVLPGIAQMGHACDVYISDLDKALQNFKVKIDQHDKDYQTQLQQVIDDARNTYESETKNAHDSLDALKSQIQANRDEQETLSQHLAGTEQQIEIHDIVTIPKHEADIDNISAAINKRLAQLHNGPTGIENAELLKSNYPNGTDGTFLALDTNHIWIWLNNQWRDAGEYQASGLSQQAQEAIENTRSVVLGNELISNGSFATGKSDPAIPWTGDTHLEVHQWSNRNWLHITSDGNSPWKGVQWNFNDSNKTYFNHPVQIDFDISSLENKHLQLYFVYYDSKGNRLQADLIDNLKLVAYKYIHYRNIFYLNQSQRNCNYVGFQLVQPSNDKIQQIIITGVSAKEVYPKNESNENLINLNDVVTNVPEITAITTKTINNQRWIKIDSVGGKQWAGAVWDFDSVQDLPYYPLQLSFDIRGGGDSKPYNFVVIIKGYNDDNTQLLSLDLPDVQVNQDKLFKYDQYVILPFTEALQCTHYQLHIVTKNKDQIDGVLITNISLKQQLPRKNNDGNLIDFSQFQTNMPNIATLIANNTNNRKWIQIISKGGDKGAGVVWNFDSVQDLPYYPLQLSFDIRGDDQQRKFDVILKGWDNSEKELVNMKLPTVLTGLNEMIHYDQVVILPQTEASQCTHFQLSITTESTDPIDYVLVSNIKLCIQPHNNNNDNLIKWQYKQFHLPVVSLQGDLTGISKDTSKKVTWKYYDDQQVLNGFGEVKWQGNSSLNFAKKSYRLKTLDADYKKKDKVKFKSSWSKNSKFNLKAYYTDGLLSRDPVNAQIGSAILASQNNLPDDIVKEDNFGFISGFPVVLFINQEYAGLYSLNTARPSFEYTKYAIMGNQWNDISQFKSTNPQAKLDGSDFESLNPDDAPNDDERKAVNDLIKFVSTSSDDEFKSHLEEHVSIDSAIDYLILNNIIGNPDAFAKNQILLSWDGKKWYFSAYDLDDSFQGSWDGTVTDKPTIIIGENHKLFERLCNLFADKIKQRYTDLRSWLTPDWILAKYRSRVDKIGVKNYQKEFAKWNNPAKDIEDFNQLRAAVYAQISLLDKFWLVSNADKINDLKKQIDQLKNVNNPKPTTPQTQPASGTEPTTSQAQPNQSNN